MPGSVTIGHTDALVMLSHDDAERLAVMLRRMSELTGGSGTDRLTDSQLVAVCEGRMGRQEFTDWSRKLAEYLKAHL